MFSADQTGLEQDTQDVKICFINGNAEWGTLRMAMELIQIRLNDDVAHHQRMSPKIVLRKLGRHHKRHP